MSEVSEEKLHSCSLVFTKYNQQTVEHALRVLITYARSEEEALGKAIKYFEEEMNGYALYLKTTLEIKLSPQTPRP